MYFLFSFTKHSTYRNERFLVFFSEDSKVQEQNRMLPLHWDAFPACASKSLSRESHISPPEWHEKQKRCNQDVAHWSERRQISNLAPFWCKRVCQSWCWNAKKRDATISGTTWLHRKSSFRCVYCLPPFLTFFLPSKLFLSQFAFTVFPRNFCQLLSHTQKTRY